jgi:hypothetical protein
MPSESFAIARGKELGPGARLGLSENRPSLGARSSGIIQKVVAKFTQQRKATLCS